MHDVYSSQPDTVTTHGEMDGTCETVTLNTLQQRQYTSTVCSV